MLVDLSECTFIDSTIIGTLVIAAEHAHASGGRCEFVTPPEAGSVHRIAQIAGLHEVLEIHETLDAGIASFQRDTPDAGSL